jgi:hypothetical protein
VGEDRVSGSEPPLRAALFVDFDNIFLSFEALDPEAARRFATRPARWLAWLERGLHAPPEEPDRPPRPRRILVRRCYLNPLQFGRFRSDYLRAAFSIVDCPPLTTRGKTSADIYMVMDLIDALEHATRFDEFIIFSSDADFTPVLLRLRAHDRRTAILCTDLAAAGYKAACDQVVPHERFFGQALGLAAGAASPARWSEEDPYAELVPRVARALRELVEERGEVAARDLPQLFNRFPEFRASSWFGRRSLKALVADLLAAEPGLAASGDPDGSWTIGRSGAAGTLETAGEPPGPEPVSDGSGAESALEAIVRRLTDLTGIPALGPGAYPVLFAELATLLAEGPRPLPDLARALEARAARHGVRIDRHQASFVLSSFRYHGSRLEGRSAAELAGEWRERVLELCAHAQLEFGPGELELVDLWLAGGAARATPPGGPVPSDRSAAEPSAGAPAG